MDSIGIWRSLSDMDLSAMGKEASRANKGATLQEDPEAEADLDRSCLITEKEETESSDDNTTQYSIHPPFDFPYFLLLQGYSHRQVRFQFFIVNHIFSVCRQFDGCFLEVANCSIRFPFNHSSNPSSLVKMFSITMNK